MAGRLINGWSYQESGNQMGRAAVCAVSARPWAFAKGSIVHAARSLLIPDPIYLAGRTTEDGRFVDPTAPQPSVLREDFLTRMAADARSRDLIPAPRTGPAWPAWSAIAGCYEAWCVTADPVRPAAGDNLYENWVIWCCLGGVVVLATRRRLAWGVVALVVALQVVPPGIAPGATPRFVVPVRAWVDLWGVWLAVACLSWVVAQVRARRRWRDERRGASLGAADTALGPPAAVAFDAAAD